jgi:hypothetical protein
MSAATPETELDVYWGPSFAKDLAKGFPHIETLCLRFSESYPEPPIINWYIIEQELEGSLPDLKNLYIINETKDTEYVPPVYINEQPRRPFNAQDLKSLRILHLPWEIVYRMRSIPPHLNRGLEELVIDVNGYVVGPLEHTKWEMVELMEDMRKVHTLIPNCNLIIWKGWAVSEEVDKKWKEGQMTEDEYHKEVVQDLVEQNNKSRCFACFWSA